MGKSLSYKKVTTETISAKGTLDSEAKTLTYVKDRVEQTVEIQSLLDKFASMSVTLTIKVQEDEELELESEDIDEYDEEDVYDVEYEENE